MMDRVKQTQSMHRLQKAADMWVHDGITRFLHHGSIVDLKSHIKTAKEYLDAIENIATKIKDAENESSNV